VSDAAHKPSFPTLTPYQQEVLLAAHEAMLPSRTVPIIDLYAILQKPLREPTLDILAECGLLIRAQEIHHLTLTHYGLAWIEAHHPERFDGDR
jgi:hypothetical protein